jgi:hypothetical protein
VHLICFENSHVPFLSADSCRDFYPDKYCEVLLLNLFGRLTHQLTVLLVYHFLRLDQGAEMP